MSHSVSPAPSAGFGGVADVFRFSLLADVLPGVLPRAIELFAKRGLVPDTCTSHVGQPRGEGERQLLITLTARALDPSVAEHIAACMRQIVGVQEVRMSAAREPVTALPHTDPMFLHRGSDVLTAPHPSLQSA